MAITGVTIEQDNIIGDGLLAGHNLLVFIAKVTYTGQVPQTLSVTVNGNDYSAIPYSDGIGYRKFAFVAGDILRSYLPNFDDYAQMDMTVEACLNIISPVITITFNADGFYDSCSLKLINSARQFGQSPNCTEIEGNELTTFIASHEGEAYLYFYNDDVNNVLTVEEFDPNSVSLVFSFASNSGIDKVCNCYDVGIPSFFTKEESFTTDEYTLVSRVNPTNVTVSRSNNGVSKIIYRVVYSYSDLKFVITKELSLSFTIVDAGADQTVIGFETTLTPTPSTGISWSKKYGSGNAVFNGNDVIVDTLGNYEFEAQYLGATDTVDVLFKFINIYNADFSQWAWRTDGNGKYWFNNNDLIYADDNIILFSILPTPNGFTPDIYACYQPFLTLVRNYSSINNLSKVIFNYTIKPNFNGKYRIDVKTTGKTHIRIKEYNGDITDYYDQPEISKVIDHQYNEGYGWIMFAANENVSESEPLNIGVVTEFKITIIK
jgi:hypothetical protein